MADRRKRNLMESKKITNPQHVVDMTDAEGWPNSLDWIYNCNFGDEQLNQLIYDATQHYTILNGFWNQIKARLIELNVDMYID